MGRILALDVGDRRIGIAVSDALNITAQGLEAYTRAQDPEEDVRYIAALLERYGAAALVVGLPKNMDGSLGFQAEKVQAFAQALGAAWPGKIEFLDERLTTVSAERVLSEAGLDWRKRRKVVDKVAAVVILQAYLQMKGA